MNKIETMKRKEILQNLKVSPADLDSFLFLGSDEKV